MDFGHHVAIASRVGRPVLAEHRGVVHFGTRSLHDQGAGVVVAACATHGSDECFVVALQNLHTGVVECPLAACAPRVVHARFVGACEEEMFVVVFEVRSNLRPESGLTGLCRCGAVGDVAGTATRIGGAFVNAVFEPAFVPVGVQNDVHAFGDGHVHHVLYLLEPCGVDGRIGECGVLADVGVCAVVGGAAVCSDVFGEGVRMRIPSARNTHGVEAGGLDGLDVGCGRKRVAPSGRIFGHFHGVADVVAHAHRFD